MPLGGYMMNTAVRIIGDRPSVATGRMERKALGTGFFVRVPSEAHGDRFYGYLITAHHVIEGQSNIELAIADPHHPGALFPLVPAGHWCHPIDDLDLAVVQKDPPPGYTVTALEIGVHLMEHLPSGMLLGAVFYYVGLLDPLNRIMARSGTLGAINDPGLLDDDPDYQYLAHLADTRSYGGFSGSPCFVEYAVPRLTPVAPPVPIPEQMGPVGRISYLHLLCGMFVEHLDRKHPPAGLVSRAGVGIVLSSDEIWRALMAEVLVEDRREKDRAPSDPAHVRTIRPDDEH